MQLHANNTFCIMIIISIIRDIIINYLIVISISSIEIIELLSNISIWIYFLTKLNTQQWDKIRCLTRAIKTNIK